MTSRVRTRFRTDVAGASALEFAIVLPVLLMVLFAIIDFGYGWYTRNIFASAMREGARVAAVALPGVAGTCSSSDFTAARTRAANYVRGALPRSNYTAASITVSCDNTTGVITVKPTAAYQYTSVMPFFSRLSSFTFRDSAMFRWERAD